MTLRLLLWRRTSRLSLVFLLFTVTSLVLFAVLQFLGKTSALSPEYLNKLGRAGKQNLESVLGGAIDTAAGSDSQSPEDLSAADSVKLENATLVMLVRNSEVHNARTSIRYVEDRFNKNFHYPWVFLNDRPFSPEFIKMTSSLVSGNASYGQIPAEHWSMPSHVDVQKARTCMREMQSKNILYGGSTSYRHMCRFFSGFFWRHELVSKYDYYWRVEPDTQLYCDVDYDPFTYMREHNKTYGFVINLKEFASTIESLWPTVRNFTRLHPDYVSPNNALKFIVDDDKDLYEGDYNLCHFWSNFEIASLDFYRSQAYLDYFDYLDKTGNFYYERWGDAPVHSIAASLFLDRSQLHWFYDFGYRHHPFTHCPESRTTYHETGKCYCNPSQNFDRNPYSCVRHWRYMTGERKVPPPH
ncbi:nucleotide-diphospho-sugar transferase [Dipodascopsis uninucleata]